MALLYRADLRPTKLELLAAWLPGRSWYQAPAGAELVRVATFRFDDPAGEVGIETFLVRAGDGPVHQVPLTYRGAPLAGGDPWLIGTTEHSVLGRRWVYDGCGDPVHAAVLAGAILAGTAQAEEYFEVDGVIERRTPLMTVTGTGTPAAEAPVVGELREVADGDLSRIVTDTVELTVVRRPAGPTGSVDPEQPGAALTGIWPGQPTPVPLAYARQRS